MERASLGIYVSEFTPEEQRLEIPFQKVSVNQPLKKSKSTYIQSSCCKQ